MTQRSAWKLGILQPLLIGGMSLKSAPLTDFSTERHYRPRPSASSLVQQLQPAGVAVISADLAVLLLVEAGRVAEGRGDGVEVGDGGGVPRRRGQGPGVALGNGTRWGAVVLIGDGGRSPPRSQGLALRQLVSQLRHTLFFLRGQTVTTTQQSSPGTNPLIL